MARYLVTGGAGFIGSHLADSLIADGHSFRVLDDLSSGSSANLPPGTELIVADVSNQTAVRRALNDVDGCFHLAAVSSVERCRQDWLRTHLVNLSGTVTVFEEARRAQEVRGRLLPVVFASSAAVYGNPSQVPISEETSTHPVSTYGVDKLGCELHAGVAGRIHGLQTVGLRLFNIYGPRQDPMSPYSGVISIFCRRVLQRIPIEIHGDGGQVRDFVYVEDAIRAMRSAMSSTTSVSRARVFNICTGVGTTVTQLGELVSRAGGAAYSPRHAPQRAGDVRISVGDPRAAREQLGFAARTSLEDGLARTLGFMSEESALTGLTA